MIYNETRYNSHWNTKKLNQLGSFARGKSKHRPRNDKRLFENGKYPLVQTGDIKAADLYITSHTQEYGDFGLKQSKLWDAGTLCITIAANIAETAILSYPMCFPDSVVGFTAYPTESSALFMHYVFTYIRNSIQKSTSGSIQDNINIDYLENLNFKIPTKEYQDKIIAVLGTIDKKIAINKRINAELEAMAKTIYDYWFVQFDFPDENGNPYRTSGGAMEWNEQFKREIPKGWKIEKIEGLLAKVPNTERIHVTEYCNEGKLPVIDQSTDYIAGYTNNENSRISTKKGAIVFGDHTRIVKYIGFDFARGADGTQVILSNNPSMPELLLYHAIKKIDLSNYGYARHFKFLKDTNIIIPERKVAEIFDEKVTPLYASIEHNIFENIELTRLRDWLLPMLMNGQATVRDETNCETVSNVVVMPKTDDERFSLWLQNQGIAARGELDRKTLREIFNAMDDDDK